MIYDKVKFYFHSSPLIVFYYYFSTIPRFSVEKNAVESRFRLVEMENGKK